jgi:GDP-L-fucose synthase
MIVVTGASGFLGKAVLLQLDGAVGLSSADVDLRDGDAVRDVLRDLAPDVVVHLAARVGGITENIARSADFLVDNTRMDANVLATLRELGEVHFIPMLSTCMYPDRLPDDAYPMGEDRIEDGPPPPTNAAYAAAKRTLLHGARSLQAQYGVPFTAIIPANLYGPGDHFGSDRSHFLAAAITKVEAARTAGASEVEFFGTGRALRQYVYVEDVARLVAELVKVGPMDTTLNVAPTENHSIADLAKAVAVAAGFEGRVTFSGTGPDGQFRKDVDTRRLRESVPAWQQIETPLGKGLAHTMEWFREHVATG